MNQTQMLNIDVVIDDKTMRISAQERLEFVQLYGIDMLVPNRYSQLLIVDLMINLKVSGIDPSLIIDEIKRLENPSVEAYTKNATQFNHPPLYPLWHQHYFSAHYLVPNIQNEIKKDFKAIWDSSMVPKGSAIEQRHLDSLVHNVVEGSIEKRSNEKRITGEWLVFSKGATGNIYLCMATHDMGDQNIFNKLAYCCERQFPSLEPFASARS